MRAHVIENNKIINTIEVESLDFMPGLVEAIDGDIGWDYINGEFIDNRPVPVLLEKDYQLQRASEYPRIQEQLDMQYWDAVNGTTNWKDLIASIKDKYPKPTE
jgi:hypothetical protein